MALPSTAGTFSPKPPHDVWPYLRARGVSALHKIFTRKTSVCAWNAIPRPLVRQHSQVLSLIFSSSRFFLLIPYMNCSPCFTRFNDVMHQAGDPFPENLISSPCCSPASFPELVFPLRAHTHIEWRFLPLDLLFGEL